MDPTADANSSPSEAKSPSKRPVHKDIGMLMFLLAAETAVVTGRLTSASSDAPSEIAPAKQAEVRYSSTSSEHSTAGESMTPVEDTTEDLFPTPTIRPGATKIPAAILSTVLSHLSWKEGLAMRQVGREWDQAVSTIVQLRPLPLSNVASPPLAAFFPCPAEFDVNDEAEERRLAFVHPSLWRCVSCGFCNGPTRVLCANRTCQRPSLTHAACYRLFLGQLRRDSTVSFLQWMLGRVVEVPVTALRSVENHRSKETSRGKGCAWVYFDRSDHAAALISCHRRVFLDVVDGREGLWLVRNGDQTLLQQLADCCGYAEHRPKALPRNALVVEHPVTGNNCHVAAATDAEIAEQYTALPEAPFDRPANPRKNGGNRKQRATAATTPIPEAAAAVESATNTPPTPKSHSTLLTHNPYTFYGYDTVRPAYPEDSYYPSAYWQPHQPPQQQWGWTGPYRSVPGRYGGYGSW